MNLSSARRAMVSVCAVLGSLLASEAIAQGTAKPERGEPLLAGPRVDDSAVQTLVQRDMTGRLQRLETRPEEAALGLLMLDPPQRELARGVLEERAAAMRNHLVDNIDLIRESTDAIRAGDQARARQLAMELYDRFDQSHRRDPLADALVAVLPEAEGAELRRLADDYWNAWIEAELLAAPGASREQVQSRLVFELFQIEATRAYEYTLRPFQQKLDAIYTAVEPTPVQREAIRGAVIEYIRSARLRPNEVERRRLAQAIYDTLDDEQRVKLIAAALTVIQ